MGNVLIERNQLLRRLPSVESVSAQEDIQSLLEIYTRPLLIEGIRRVLDDKRHALLADEKPANCERINVTAEEVKKNIKDWFAEPLRPVINATGVVIHTNLGRAPLSDSCFLQLSKVLTSYSNLEFNLYQGIRGSRTDLIKPILRELTGAEDALVVNNNAAAVYLALKSLSSGREVIVSRGELVEIGGSFRIPDVMAASGAKLIEVGTTNRTHIEDYQKAIGPDTALILKVHRSNFELVGYTQEVAVEQLADLGRASGIPFMMDMGSGTLLNQLPVENGHQFIVQNILKSDPDLICFSGDKLLGGPQCGILLGKTRYIAAMAKDPMARALRVGKLTLSSLWATLSAYRGGTIEARSIPVIDMLLQEPHELKEKAEQLFYDIQQRKLSLKIEICQSSGKVGGGSMPLINLPGFGVALCHHTIKPEQFIQRLRSGNPTVIARLYQDRLILDVRTVLGNTQLKSLAEAVESACL